MVNKALVSIITVSAFDSTRLEKTLRSCSEISNDVEHIIVLPSTDYDSQELCSKFNSNNNVQRIIALDGNSGIYPAMNIGAKISTGKYIIFWNSGDELFSTANLDSLLCEIAIEEPSWAICAGEFHWKLNENPSIDLVNRFVVNAYSSFISHQTVLVSRKVFFDLGGLNENFKVAADTAMITLLKMHSEPLVIDKKVVMVEKPEYASMHQRRARLEVLLISIIYLKGKTRIKSLWNLLYRESTNYYKKKRPNHV